ncbi:hypothetical protein E4T56_gene993 [Termitomyces sp. T112]|nr:hypothetical protein E4T56_gene993 [Termitomyces sp. T112]
MEHKSAEYFQKQPFGQVPYIDDDGFILYENCAMVVTLLPNMPTKEQSLSPLTPRKLLSLNKPLQLCQPGSEMPMGNNEQ